jgi:biotin operon repressor
MSNEAINWAYKQRTGSSTRKSVLIALADQANSDGTTYLGQESIARKLEMSDRTVRRAISELQEGGFLRVEARKWEDSKRQRTNLYWLSVGTKLEATVSGRSVRLSKPEDTESYGPEDTMTGGPEDTVSSQEPLAKEPLANEPKTLGPDRPTARKPKAPDELWDTLVAATGYAPETKSERGKWNRALKELRDLGATPEQVEARCREYQRRWPTMSLSPNALAGHWAALAQKSQVDPRNAPAPYRNIGPPPEPPEPGCEHTPDESVCDECRNANLARLREMSAGVLVR